ncbi:hypothetical protein [Mycobacterium sp.]|uniref:hypothetical protein n=1 Tax=Mycobacterium sp. TaxID=1785 RepID=UPI00128023BB|nr:hypothetical protein [Mycobacterium sp.]KAA8960489.1 MAG: hypothetical protein F6Q13_13375 [Mycobacterium sp.]
MALGVSWGMTLGAATGLLPGAAFLSIAAAFADDYEIFTDPGSIEEVTGIYGTGILGAFTTPPAAPGGVEGDQLFSFVDTTTGATGTFEGYESTLVGNNQEVLVTSDVSGTDAPPVGSVFDTYIIGADSDLENVYSAIPSASGGDIVSDTLTTPLGNYPISVSLDAADVPAVDASGVPLGNGVDFVPGSALTLTAITGIPPLFMALQGDQLFDVDDAGASVGSFTADVTPTTDDVGTHTEAALVTSDVSGSAGTGAGDVPPAGSVFNTIEIGGLENFYSAIPTTSGGDVSDTLMTPLGNFSIPVMDATAAEAPASVDLPDGYDIAAVPGSTETFTGINGLPPLNVAIQGQGEFDLESGGAVVGIFDADQTTTLDLFGDTTQTLLVTADGSIGTVGTAAGDLPPVGSVIETFSVAGIEDIYTDLASTTPGGEVVSDTLVTPLGDFAIPITFDLPASLATDLFLNVLP